MYPVIVITVSDRSWRGERLDASGPEAVATLPADTYTVLRTDLVPDEAGMIRDALLRGVGEDVALIVTTGGTGFAPRDVTPEATLAIIERRADGLTDLMRAASLTKTKFAVLSRAVCGIANRTLIVNLPGSPKAVRECLEALLPVLPHALGVLRGDHGLHG